MKKKQSKPSQLTFQKQSRGQTPYKYKTPKCPYHKDVTAFFLFYRVGHLVFLYILLKREREAIALQHTSIMYDWSFAAGLTLLNIVLTLYIVKPRKSTLRLIYWVSMLTFICIYPVALLSYSVQNPSSYGLFLGLAFVITVSFSVILIFSVCWVWVIRHSFFRQ